MIAPSVVREVRRLLDEGKFSQRKIARMMRVSRGTVGAIAAGKRPDYEALSRNRRDEWSEHLGPLERCPGCGGTVYMPCRACRTRSAASNSPKPPIVRLLMQFDEPLGLDLTEEHQTRYEDVRSAAMARQRAVSQPVEAESSREAVDAWDDWDEPEAEKAHLWDEWGEWAEGEIDDDPIAARCEERFVPGPT